MLYILKKNELRQAFGCFLTCLCSFYPNSASGVYFIFTRCSIHSCQSIILSTCGVYCNFSTYCTLGEAAPSHYRQFHHRLDPKVSIPVASLRLNVIDHSESISRAQLACPQMDWTCLALEERKSIAGCLAVYQGGVFSECSRVWSCGFWQSSGATPSLSLIVKLWWQPHSVCKVYSVILEVRFVDRLQAD